ncbi:MAG TPA: C39 family peptidase, partial [Candidatus Binatia bacterium]|nr:C39 family peptidase [Candidatus Binatia bacterium]
MRDRTIPFLLLAACLLPGCAWRRSPPAASINVPFTSQAPAGDWSEPWQNACEETSIYMVGSFYAEEPIKRDQAIARIKEIFRVKQEKFRVSKDESLETIAALIEELGLPWKARIVYDPKLEDIKAELAEGRPVIAPVYAPALGNPYYGSPAPDYHVLVLTGYDDAAGVFIVNDPGTRRGEGLRFPYATMMGAIHDLDAKDVRNGKKAVLFTSQSDWT